MEAEAEAEEVEVEVEVEASCKFGGPMRGGRDAAWCAGADGRAAAWLEGGRGGADSGGEKTTAVLSFCSGLRGPGLYSWARTRACLRCAVFPNFSGFTNTFK